MGPSAGLAAGVVRLGSPEELAHSFERWDIVAYDASGTDAGTDNFSLRVLPVGPLPDGMSGRTLHNLRSGLFHFTYSLVGGLSDEQSLVI